MKKYIASFLILIVLLSLTSCSNSRLPEIQEGEFPFQIVYESGEETVTIEDTVICEFNELTPYYIVPGSFRTWNVSLKSGDKRHFFTIYEEENKESVFNQGRINLSAKVYINYGAPEYYMGDPRSKSMTKSAPSIEYVEFYQESEKVVNSFSKTLSISDARTYFGINITTFAFSDPIKNSFKSFPSQAPQSPSSFQP